MFIGLASTNPQVGKSTISEHLSKKHDFIGTECSDPVVHIAKKYFGFNGNKLDPQQRLILQKLGLMGKEIEPTLWVYYSLLFNWEKSPLVNWLNWENYLHIKERCEEVGVEEAIVFGDREVKDVYLSGVRSPDEADEILRLGGEVWLIRRKAVEGAEGSKHKVENQLSSYNKFTTIIDNDGTIEELYDKVDKLVE